MESISAEARVVKAEAGNGPLCTGLGAGLLGFGLFGLFFFPGRGEVVNYQMLYIEQTLAIVGGVLLAAGIRPR